MVIPIYIVSYNNGILVRNTVDAVKKFKQPIYVIDNNSDCPDTIKTLNQLELENITIIRYSNNKGPWRILYDEEYSTVRKHPFILTDPDLGLETLKEDALEILVEVQEKYKARKVGLALDISDIDDLISGHYCVHEGVGYNIVNWETRFWQNSIGDEYKNPIYKADIDTTFCLYNFAYESGSLRVAGELTVKHYPWHKSFINSLSVGQVVSMFRNPAISTSSKLAWRHKQIRKVGDFIVFNGPQSCPFWDVYPTWKREVFSLIDKLANEKKNALDIGCWIGPTLLYMASKFHHVYGVDADIKSFSEVMMNVTFNDLNHKTTLLPVALYKNSGYVSFGKNRFLPNAILNDSTSQVQQYADKDTYPAPCLTFDSLIEKYNINNLGLIKINIEGGEEYILEQALQYSFYRRVPTYITFHYDWWENKDLSRFRTSFELFPHINANDMILSNPSCSILFTS